MSYIQGPLDLPLISATVPELLLEAASKFKDQTALVVEFQDVRCSFKELADAAFALSNGLTSLGLRCKDMIGIFSFNCYESVLSALAAWSCGLVVVFLHNGLAETELESLCQRIPLKAVFVGKSFNGPCLLHVFRKWNLPIIVAGKEDAMNQEGSGLYPFTTLLEGNVCLETIMERIKRIETNGVAAILFTSGTTSTPKAVQLSQHSLINMGNISGQFVGLQKGDTILLPCQMCHLYGAQKTLLFPLLHGVTGVLPSYGYSSSALLRVANKEKCTHIFGVQTMLSDMLTLLGKEDVKLPSLKCYIVTGSIAGEQLLRLGKKVLPDVSFVNGYGSTEAGGAVLLTSPKDPIDFAINFVGRPLPGNEVKVVDPLTGTIVPFGDVGEIMTRTIGMFLGYYGEDGLKGTIDSNGWLHTGDYGLMREDGVVKFISRIEETIFRGGAKVHPEEVEKVIRTHPLVKDVAVFGLPDERMGEVVAAVVTGNKEGKGDSSSLNETSLRLFCHDKLSAFKIPERIYVVDKIDRNPLGKVNKRDLMKLFSGRFE